VKDNTIQTGTRFTRLWFKGSEGQRVYMPDGPMRTIFKAISVDGSRIAARAVVFNKPLHGTHGITNFVFDTAIDHLEVVH
jgi:hypothetical protein